jgi:hypothetical protein
MRLYEFVLNSLEVADLADNAGSLGVSLINML